MERTVTKSIAIIGEGETEWFYFDSLRIARRYPFFDRVQEFGKGHGEFRETVQIIQGIAGRLECVFGDP